MDNERAKKNFSFWKKLVNLPDYFPSLKPLKSPPLTSDEISELVVIRPETEREIMNALFSKSFTQIIVPDGNGLSTIFRYIFGKCSKKALDKLTIPVAIDLETIPEKTEISPEFLEQQIKKQVLLELVNNPWDDVLAEEHYYWVINYQEDREYQVYRAEVLDFLSGKKEKAWITYCRSFPSLKENLDDFLNYLLENLRIKTILFFHIPRSLAKNEERILELVSSLKIIHEKNAFKSASISEIYFINESVQSDLNREYKRDFYSIHYPQMTAAEIFSMMNKRFRPSLPGQMGRMDRIDLGAVFSEDFIRQCWSNRYGIRDIIEKIEQMILEQMDCERKEVPYKLIPTTKPSTTESTKEPTEKKPRRFKRKRVSQS